VDRATVQRVFKRARSKEDSNKKKEWGVSVGLILIRMSINSDQNFGRYKSVTRPLTPEDRAKVLDFRLATAPAGPAVILGTAAT
jgi:hypothetical protein